MQRAGQPRRSGAYNQNIRVESFTCFGHSLSGPATAPPSVSIEFSCECPQKSNRFFRAVQKEMAVSNGAAATLTFSGSSPRLCRKRAEIWRPRHEAGATNQTRGRVEQ